MRDKLGQYFSTEKSVCKVNSSDDVIQGKNRATIRINENNNNLILNREEEKENCCSLRRRNCLEFRNNICIQLNGMKGGKEL